MMNIPTILKSYRIREGEFSFVYYPPSVIRPDYAVIRRTHTCGAVKEFESSLLSIMHDDESLHKECEECEAYKKTRFPEGAEL